MSYATWCLMRGSRVVHEFVAYTPAQAVEALDMALARAARCGGQVLELDDALDLPGAYV